MSWKKSPIIFSFLACHFKPYVQVNGLRAHKFIVSQFAVFSLYTHTFSPLQHLKFTLHFCSFRPKKKEGVESCKRVLAKLRALTDQTLKSQHTTLRHCCTVYNVIKSKHCFWILAKVSHIVRTSGVVSKDCIFDTSRFLRGNYGSAQFYYW